MLFYYLDSTIFAFSTLTICHCMSLASSLKNTEEFKHFFYNVCCMQALKAQQDGADYVGTGAVYPTNTKVKGLVTLPVPVHDATT